MHPTWEKLEIRTTLHLKPGLNAKYRISNYTTPATTEMHGLHLGTRVQTCKISEVIVYIRD